MEESIGSVATATVQTAKSGIQNFVATINQIEAHVWGVVLIVIGGGLHFAHQAEAGMAIISGGLAIFSPRKTAP